PCTKRAPERALQRSLNADFGNWPDLRALGDLDQPRELFRRKLRVMMARLEQTSRRAPGAHRGPDEFVRDAKLLEESVRHLPGPRVARLAPERLRVAAEVFGFHAV